MSDIANDVLQQNENQQNNNNFDNDFNPNLLGQPINNINDDADQAVPVQSNQAPEDATAEGNELAAAHESIQKAKADLLASKVVHLGITFSDSDNMTRVKTAIRELDKGLTGIIPKEQASFETALEQIKGLYSELIHACVNYVGNIKKRGRGKSESGKNRLNLTNQILEHTRKEYGAFQVYAKQYFDEHGQDGKDWTAVLYRVRAKDMSAEASGYEVVSGAISTVYKRTANGKTTYIKAEESLAWNDSKEGAMDLFLHSGAPEAEKTIAAYKLGAKGAGADIAEVWDNVDKALEQRFNEKNSMSPQEYKKYAQDRKKRYLDSAITILSRDEECAKYIKKYPKRMKDFLVYVFRKSGEYYAATTHAGIAPGSAISNRNVSTSRVAERLEMQDTVAKSETILMTAEDGSMINANEMEEAGQMTLYDCLAKAEKWKCPVKYRPQALRQTWELQVLDLICGQVDRHANNYSATYSTEGSGDNKILYIESIKAFDNDMSFGIKTLSAMNKGTQARALISGGRISVPFLPKSFYENIMNYSSELAAHDQLDIRSRDEIRSLQQRLEQIKAQLAKLVKDGKLKLLDSEADWEKAANDYYANWKKRMYAESYVFIQ
ncbi:hypothetical protein [Pseudobutyrivibrio sp.]|uniref:hypothetical protein n=1 Tax=Pseudobutyrivibrio sp. TaxID=2014367 RepID=UPI001B796C92|nr:hypothetical protein [Pseudobutyrivibrio sp.]MBP3260997.1 hypothetical protein [Pseudobutyrivibrio sp.]